MKSIATELLAKGYADLSELTAEYLEEDEEEYEADCPNCGTVISLPQEALDKGYINCPTCWEKLELAVE